MLATFKAAQIALFHHLSAIFHHSKAIFHHFKEIVVKNNAEGLIVRNDSAVYKIKKEETAESAVTGKEPLNESAETSGSLENSEAKTS